MGAVRATIRLVSLDDKVRAAHGSPRALVPDEIDVVRTWGELMLDFIQASWPVDTGASRDAWSFFIDPSPNSMAIVIENPMFYADFVHRAGDPTRSPIWEAIIVEAWGLARQGLILAASAAIDRTERGTLGGRPAESVAAIFARVFGPSTAPVL